MRELSKFCWIYCHDNHKKWAELLPHIEGWINNIVASATGYNPSELMYGSERRNVLSRIVPSRQTLEQEGVMPAQHFQNLSCTERNCIT
jgi:hypothetical protein